MKFFPYLESRRDLAEAIGVPLKSLSYVLFVKGTENCYSSFNIQKKTGGTRQINAPNSELKKIQKKLAKTLYDYQQEIYDEIGVKSLFSHGFERNKNIFSNAKVHVNKKYIINLDLENFFDSFHFGRVCGYFEKNKYFKLNHLVAVTIAQIACYKGRLPQGAPSSPIITNLICQALDLRVYKVAKKYKLDYTRYADDLTFSTNNTGFRDNYDNFIDEISYEINKMGFSINTNKTRLVYKDSCQKVTGVVVNKKINIDHDYYKKTRAMANSLYNNNFFTIDGKRGTLSQLDGRFAFIDRAIVLNNRKDDKKHDGLKLSGREKEYQKFLFYKYFYASEKPVIITEGKTDVIYIKAALKKLYSFYPELVTRKEDGSFEYNVIFLKRTKHIQYFFNISKDGADTFKFIYNCICNKGRGSKNYYDYFKTKTGFEAKNPIIIIFDNETISEKPLKKFICSTLSKNDKQNLNKELLLKQLFYRVSDSGNLYFAITPLVNNKKESEIEDLFQEKALKLEIEGRTFDRKEKKGDNLHFGKNCFANYIYNNYHEIDFDGFIPLLDALKNIIVNYNSEK